MAPSDLLVLLGLVSVGVALWFLLGWPGVLLWAGMVLMVTGVAEARRKS